MAMQKTLTHRSLTLWLPTMAVWLVMCLLAVIAPAAHADEAKVQDKSKQTAVLFISHRTSLDETFARKLADRNIVSTVVSYGDALDPAFLRKFNVFVFSDFYRVDATPDTHPSVPALQHNLAQINKLVDQGAGLLAYTMSKASHMAAWNREMARYGIGVDNRGINDPSVAGLERFGYGDKMNSFAWTENLDSSHPVTRDLRRVYYPVGEMNQTGIYCARPLVLKDAAWTPLVQTMDGAQLFTVHPPGNDRWPETSSPQRYTVAAARDLQGKAGRVAAFAIHPEMTHRGGYTGSGMGELTTPASGDAMLESGNGVVPSDTLEMLLRLHTWLGAESHEAGLGGYKPGDPVETIELPERDADADMQTFKVLVGPRTKYSDGDGSVADYASAAKAAGYSAVLFAETFEELDPDQWRHYWADCEAASSDVFVALPGFQIEDTDGNTFIVIAPPSYPHDAWIDDKKRLINPYTPNFYWYGHHFIIHRAASSPLVAERLKHYQGISVFTYRDGELIDNSRHAYEWAINSASFPKPFTVHELSSPDEVAGAATTGFQQFTPEGADLEQALARLCRGMDQLGHPMISEGPKVDFQIGSGYDPRIQGPDAARVKAQQAMRVFVTASSESPITDVTLYDGFRPIRRWRGSDADFKAEAVLPFSRQYELHIVAEDARGNQAMKTDFWVSPGSLYPERHGRFPGHFRAHDRQNWLGAIPVYYTGSIVPFGHINSSMSLETRGFEEGRRLFGNLPGTAMAPKIDFPFTSNDVIITDYVLDEKYIDAVWDDVGLAATPSYASKASSLYEGRIRYYHFTQTHPGQPYVGLVEYDLTIKRDLEPENPLGLFPALMRAANKEVYTWQQGKGIVKQEARQQDVATAPRGSIIGGMIPLDDRFGLHKSWFGRTLESPGYYLPAETKLTGRFLQPSGPIQKRKAPSTFADAPETWLKALGFAGDLPYSLKVTRGQLGDIAFLVPIKADKHGAFGSITKTGELPYDLPLEVAGLNSNWSAGKWRPGKPVEFIGVFQDRGWALIDAAQAGDFFAGNLITATDAPHLILAIDAWDTDRIIVEAHNPTQQLITTTIATQPEVKGHKPLKKTITVEPGQSVFIEE